MSNYIVVTGASRGLGKELSKQLAKLGYNVLITARDEKKGKDVLEEISAHSPKSRLLFHELDVSNEKSIKRFGAYLKKEMIEVDILVNNAGIMVNSDSTISVEKKEMQRSFDTNFYGPLLVSQELIPYLQKSGHGKIINVSSGMGSFHELFGGYAAYRISKTALNSLTAIMSKDLVQHGIKVFSVCPGWVKTDMGGAAAPRNVQQGVDSIKWLITKNEGVSGKFYRDKKQISF